MKGPEDAGLDPEEALSLDLREAGYTDRAKAFPLEGVRLEAFAAWCGVEAKALPRGYRYAANATSLARLDALIEKASSDPGATGEDLYLTARNGRPGDPGKNVVKTYQRVADAVRKAKA